MQFRTERLLLREMEIGDLPAHAAICADPIVMQYMTGRPISHEEAKETLRKWIAKNQATPRTGYVMAITLPDEQRHLGRCALYEDKTKGVAFLGYHISRGYWGKGYMTEAARTLMDFGFTQLGLHRLYAECDPENIGSARVMQKLGMTYEGRLRSNRKNYNDIWCDSLVYAILEDEWRDNQNCTQNKQHLELAN